MGGGGGVGGVGKDAAAEAAAVDMYVYSKGRE